TTCFINGPTFWPTGSWEGYSCGRLFQVPADEHCTVLDQFTILCAEGGRRMTINIEFPDHCALNVNRDHDLGFRLDRARKISGITGDIVDHNSLASRSSSSTNSLVQRDPRMWRRGSSEWSQNQHR